MISVFMAVAWYGCISFAVAFGLNGVAWALLGVVTMVSLPMMWRSVSRVLDMSVMRILERFWRPVTASAFMYVTVVQFIDLGLLADTALVFQILAAVFVGIFAYLASVVALWGLVKMPEGGERIIWSMVQTRLSKFV